MLKRSSTRRSDDAAKAIRALMERIMFTPGARRGEIAATRHGDIRMVLERAMRASQKNKTELQPQ